VLKQLYKLIGADNFSNNIGRYFKKYAWKNASLENFLEELSQTPTEKTLRYFGLA